MIQQSNASRPAVSYCQLVEVYVCVGIYNRWEALHCIYLSQMPVLHGVLLTLGAIVEIDNKIEGIYYPLISYRCWDINYQARCFSCREKVRDWLYFYCFLKEIGENVFNQIFLPLCFIAVCFIFEKIIKLCMIIWKDPQLWGVAMFFLNE